MWLELLHHLHEGWRQYVHNPLANTIVGLAGCAVAILSPVYEAIDFWLDRGAKTLGVLVAILSLVNLGLTIHDKLRKGCKRD
jgi:hypothetical protein